MSLHEMSLHELTNARQPHLARRGGMGMVRVNGMYTAISTKVVGKMRTRQSRKVIWDMINTLFLTTVPVEPTFVVFL